MVARYTRAASFHCLKEPGNVIRRRKEWKASWARASLLYLSYSNMKTSICNLHHSTHTHTHTHKRNQPHHSRNMQTSKVVETLPLASLAWPQRNVYLHSPVLGCCAWLKWTMSGRKLTAKRCRTTKIDSIIERVFLSFMRWPACVCVCVCVWMASWTSNIAWMLQFYYYIPTFLSFISKASD